jgi:hypothetical protein
MNRAQCLQMYNPAPTYIRNEVNVCKDCKQTYWLVGRVTAECANCGYPMPLSHPQSHTTEYSLGGRSYRNG